MGWIKYDCDLVQNDPEVVRLRGIREKKSIEAYRASMDAAQAAYNEAQAKEPVRCQWSLFKEEDCPVHGGQECVGTDPPPWVLKRLEEKIGKKK